MTEIRRNNTIKIAVLIGIVKFLQSVCKQTECDTEKDTLCVHELKLSGSIEDTLAGSNDIVYDNNIFSVNVISQELVGHDRIPASYNRGIVPAFVKHTGIYTEDTCKIDGTTDSPLIGTDNNSVFLVNEQIRYIFQQRLHELVMCCKIIKTCKRNCILDTKIMGVKGDDIGDSHGI